MYIKINKYIHVSMFLLRNIFKNKPYLHGWEEQQPVFTICEESSIFAIINKLDKYYHKKINRPIYHISQHDKPNTS